MNASETILPNSGLLNQQYTEVRNQTLQICEPLKTEDYVVQPIEEVSPPKWHLGHTTWFFESFILQNYLKDYRPYNEYFSYIFNSYYESIGKRVIRANRGNLTRPTLEEVLNYRTYVDRKMNEFLNSPDQITERGLQIFQIGLQHEQQHQELLIYDIKYILGTNPLFPIYKENKSANGAVSGNTTSEENYLRVKEDVYTIGHEGKGFCFDNELGQHKVFIHNFEILNRLITNQEYLMFIQDGGYSNFRYWLSEGWEWVKENSIVAPLYWFLIEGEWHFYTLQGLKKIDLNAPVTHISFYEADAFANWKGKRLPTEYEWEIACKTFSPNIPLQANLLDQAKYEPVYKEKDNLQFYGDAWEWTGSAYRPYPFYKIEEGALGEYNGKFMINQMVLRGGSFATPRNHIRATYRNFFQPHLRWHFTGIRLAQTL